MGTSTTYTATGSNVFNNTFDYNNSLHNADLDNGLFTVLGTMNYTTSTFAATVTSFDAHLSTQSGSDLLTIRNGFTSTWNSASETVTTSGNQVFLNNSLVGTYSFSNQDLAFSFSSGNNNPVTLGAVMDAVAYQNTATTRPDFTENVSFSFGTSAGSVSAPSAAIEVGFLPTPVISPAEIDFNANLSGTVATYPNTPVYILPNAHVTGHPGSVTNNQGQQEVWDPRWSTVSVSFVNANPGDRLIFDTSTKIVDGPPVSVLSNGFISNDTNGAIVVETGWPGTPGQILVDHFPSTSESVFGVNPALDYILQSIQYENVSGSPSSSVQIAVSIGVGTAYVIGPPLLGGSFFPLIDNEPQRVFTVILTPLPTVVTETATVTAGGSVAGSAGTNGTGALAGDSDANGFSLSIFAVTGGTIGSALHGSYGDLTLQADGSYTYTAGATAAEQTAIATAATGSHPSESFTYTVSDGNGGTSSSTLIIIINRPPVLTAPSIGGTNIFQTNGFANITDPDGDALTVTGAGTSPAGISPGNFGPFIEASAPNSEVSIGPGGGVGFALGPIDTSPATVHNNMVISYAVSDGHGGSVIDSAFASVDRAPIATTHAFALTGGPSSSGTILDTDPDNVDFLRVTEVNGVSANVGMLIAGTYGHLILSSGGFFGQPASYSYVADNTSAIDGAPPGFLVDSFTYTVWDGFNDGISGLPITANETLTFTIDTNKPTIAAIAFAPASGERRAQARRDRHDHADHERHGSR
jgi:VCBS repeat-containing protein